MTPQGRDDGQNVDVSGGGWRGGGAVSWTTGAAALLGVAAVAQTVIRGIDDRDIPSLAVLCLIALATTVPLALPRPLWAALLIPAACLVSLLVFDELTIAALLATVLALFRTGRRGLVALTLLAYPVMILVLALAGELREVSPMFVALGVVAAAAAAAGVGARLRELSRDRDAVRGEFEGSQLEHLARGERARIARELHDVVAHHISMVVVQAESTRVTTPDLQPAVERRLVEISDTARAGLSEMRRLLGVLREDAEEDELPERHPQPGLGQLYELVDDARSASGAALRLISSGVPLTLDPGVELAAYRIVQEALTNARRHAPGGAVDVELHYGDDELRVRVRDNGPGPPASVVDRPGHGLQGMRERAAAVGGELRAGPSTVGGFLVEARLPAKAEVAR
jgi:signal transduction histidine kinase